MWNSYIVHLWTFLFTVTISAEIVLKYHNYEEMTTKLQNLVAKYPDLLSLYQLDGTSMQGNFTFRGAFTNYVDKMRQVGNLGNGFLLTVKKFIHKSQPGPGQVCRWSRMGQIWSTQFMNTSLFSTKGRGAGKGWAGS